MCIISWSYGFANPDVDSAYISPNDCKIDSLRQFLGLHTYIYIYIYIHIFIAHVFVLYIQYDQTVCIYIYVFSYNISPVSRRLTAQELNLLKAAETGATTSLGCPKAEYLDWSECLYSAVRVQTVRVFNMCELFKKEPGMLIHINKRMHQLL